MVSKSSHIQVSSKDFAGEKYKLVKELGSGA